ncbi:MAG: AmmeMemoRadiSam system radical SAM enzyme [Thermodesulfobacteriota bacterium]|nr:AmmeMemoRadiSam system radical SAM enzyme [Thermodesulfobacteriota bacterium]
MLYERLSDEKVQCNLCAHRCVIQKSKKGICGLRENINGKLYVLNYGKLIAKHVDPIEKKPLFHFFPGSTSYSVATAGCNFQCEYCQNYDISQMPFRENRIIGQDSSPEETLVQAIQLGCKSIAYTYTEPTIFYEYAYDVAQLAHERNVNNVFITNGFITSEALQTIAPELDAANVDLKSFSNNFYKKICKGKLQPVLDTIKILFQLGIWVEVTTLVIPTLNDIEQEFHSIAEFIMGVSREIPWHISAFYPAYKLKYLPPTPFAVLDQAQKIGLETGLHYVYLGNVKNSATENTRCPACGQILIERKNFESIKNIIQDGHCPNCGREIAGVGM